MIKFIGLRLLQSIPTIMIVSLIIFSLQKLMPGDPALIMAGEDSDPAVIEQLRARYNLDKPIPVQYFIWLSDVMRGDFGTSLRLNENVSTLILQKFPVTLQLSVMAMSIALAIGIPAGVASAVWRGSWADYIVNLFALFGVSTPNFWTGIMFILLFSVTLRWLPASGYVSPSEDLLMSLRTTIMPAFVLGLSAAGILMRHTRSAMIQTLESDYIRTARAKGLKAYSVIVKHAARNALTPVITLAAIEFGGLLGGAILTEQIFSIPGLGKLIVDAVFNRDYAVVQGVVLLTAVLYLAINLLADIAYLLANPRLRN